MGEKQKSIGEIGEEMAGKFFKLIGWDGLLKNEDIPCIQPNLHKYSGSDKRTTHGVDIAYSYRSQTESNTIQSVVISCKTTEKNYPNNPVSKFKEHVGDLIQLMACFSRSDLKRRMAIGFKNYTRQVDCGVLVWISLEDPSAEVISAVSKCQLPDSYDFGMVCLVDNSVIKFHYDVVEFIRKNYTGYDYSYFVPHTALSISDQYSARKTKILPVEYINSPFVWIVLEKRIIQDEKPILLLVTKDEFSSDALSMYVYAARDLAVDLTDRFYFGFYDYVDHRDSVCIEDIKRSQADAVSLDLEVKSINSDFRGM